METSDGPVFVDSNFFIALFNPLDALYPQAVRCAKEIEERQITLIVSSFIFLETVTVLSQRGGKPVAKEGGQYFLTDPAVRLVHIDEDLQKESWRIFQEIEDKDVSFVDASIIAAMHAEGVSNLLTFDTNHFTPLSKRYRFRLYPIA